jgi:ComF family protein
MVLCEECAFLLQPIDPHRRCVTCFTPLKEEFFHICQDCLHEPSHYTKVGAVFDYEGPAASLVKQMKYANQPLLTKGMAAFLFTQLDLLQWPMPDVIIPVPLSFMHRLERGYNQSELLAEELGQLLQRPVLNVLKRGSGDFRQASLLLEDRKTLNKNRFKLKKNASLLDKHVLVIDDVMTSGSTLRCCAETLSAGCPASLRALVFCRT